MRIDDGSEYMGGYHSVPPRRALWLSWMLGGYGGDKQSRVAGEILRLYDVRYLVLPNTFPAHYYDLRARAVNRDGMHTMIFEDKLAERAVYFPDRFISRESEIGIFAAMMEPDWTIKNAVVKGGISGEKILGRALVQSYSRIYETREYLLDATHQALAIIPETWCPGWRARLDGRPVHLECVNWFLLGIFIPPGKHSLVVRYDPISFHLGLWLSCVAITLAFLALIARNPGKTAPI